MSSQHSTSSAEHPRRPSPRKRHPGGINPWVPNQHGAWAMLVAPMLVGAVIGLAYEGPSGQHHRAAIPAIAIAWMLGYFWFFAYGLWFKARSANRKAQYARPMLVYGVVSALAGLFALIQYPGLAWWALIFAPLVAVAVEEIIRRRPRSLISGIATTLASSALLLVMVSAGEFAPMPWFFFNVPAEIWVVALSTALYYVGTIFYVKTMIREKGNAPFENLSHNYHAVAVVLTIVATATAFFGGGRNLASTLLLITVITAAWWRSVAIPADAQKNPATWTPKKVGLWEIPLVLALIAAGVAVV
ncbi:YwiC-like family protein [Corynebacterium auriscanis]|uniref:YwiC-like family protein n=1 Tax=Corynebacterium auriscanis TaxID=99807 RepID=UPI003CECE340